MTIKRKKEPSDVAKLAWNEAVTRVRGTAVRNVLWDTVLTDSDYRWLKRHVKDEELKSLGPVAIWMKLHGVSYEQAVLDVADKSDLLSSRTLGLLLREIESDERTGGSPDVYRSLQECKLVLIEVPRSANWKGQIFCEEPPWGEKIWTYLWRLAMAAQRGAAITPRDFGLSHAERGNLSTWKCRLTNRPGFPRELAALISSERCEHRLNLPSSSIRLFPRD